GLSDRSRALPKNLRPQHRIVTNCAQSPCRNSLGRPRTGRPRPALDRMQLDIPTLTVAGSFVAFLSSLLVAGAWTQVPRTQALLWWAVAILLIAMGTAL